MEELREKYGRLLKSLESEKSELAAERDKLLDALAAAAKQGDDVRRRLKQRTGQDCRSWRNASRSCISLQRSTRRHRG